MNNNNYETLMMEREGVIERERGKKYLYGSRNNT